MAEAFIKIHRKMLNWEWYDDPNTFRLFMHCLLKANWQEKTWHGVTVEPGQFITSLSNLAEETQLSVRQVRTALDHLISTGEVTSKSQSKYRLITVCKWDMYQASDKQNDKQATKKRQGDDKQATTTKEYKEYKEREELKELKNNIEQYFPNDELLNAAFGNFVTMRKQTKHPMTSLAIELAIKELNNLSGGDNEKAIKIINQSIMRGWQGLFPLKEEKVTNKPLTDDDWSKI